MSVRPFFPHFPHRLLPVLAKEDPLSLLSLLENNQNIISHPLLGVKSQYTTLGVFVSNNGLLEIEKLTPRDDIFIPAWLEIEVCVCTNIFSL